MSGPTDSVTLSSAARQSGKSLSSRFMKGGLYLTMGLALAMAFAPLQASAEGTNAQPAAVTQTVKAPTDPFYQAGVEVRKVVDKGQEIGQEAGRVGKEVGLEVARVGKEVGLEAGRVGKETGQKIGQAGKRFGQNVGKAARGFWNGLRGKEAK